MTDTETSKAPDPVAELDWIRGMARQTETSLALVAGARLEDWLERALKVNMRELSATVTNRIFAGYGPLSTFAAKIDIAFAIRVIDEAVYNDMRAIKDIRNKFAHSKEILHFASPELATEINRLTTWSQDADRYMVFANCIKSCIEALKPHLKRAAMIEALKNYTPSVQQDESGE